MRRIFITRSECVLISIPSATGKMQEARHPRRALVGDLDDAEPARSVGRQRFVSAEGRDVDPRLAGHFENGAPLLGGDFFAVDYEL